MTCYSVTGITHKAEGIIRMDGKVCFVKGALPGEAITIRNLKSKKKFSHAQLDEVKQSATYRKEPVCQEFHHCGGCVWQHITYDQQLLFKQQIIHDQLKRIGGLSCEVRPTIGMEEPSHYRNKITLHCVKDPKTGQLKLGFFDEKSARPVALATCILAPSDMLSLVGTLQESAAKLRLQPGDEVMIRKSSFDGSLLLLIQGKPDTKELLPLCEVHPGLTNICTRQNGKLQKVLGETSQMQQLAGCTFRISAGSFYQTNPTQTEKLYGIVRDTVKEIAKGTPKTILDAFCGAGTISCMLAKDGHAVTGIENNPFSIENARENAALNGVNADFICAPCEEGLSKIPKDFDIIVVDPPRAGCMKETLQAMVEKAPEHIIYVSCEPATLARDLKILTGNGYTPQFVQPVDMFPWAGHCECVGILAREKL